MNPIIAGNNVTLGATTYVMPPMPFAALKKHREFLKRAMNGDVLPEQFFDADMDTMFDCIYLALKRNYPQLTEDQLAADLDQRNLPQAFQAMMASSGFQEKTSGEARGEALPAASPTSTA